MSTPDHTVLEFRPPAIPDPVPIDDAAFAAWLDELADAAADDSCESCQQLPATVIVQFPDGGTFDVCPPCSTLRGTP